MSIVAGTKFITYNPNLDLKERRSKGPNSETRVYTIEDIVTAATVTPVTEMSYAASDATTPLTVSDAGVMFATHDMTIQSVFGAIGIVGGTSGVTTIDIKKNGVSILSTLITVDFGEATSLTAAVQPVVSVSSILKGDRISTNITTISGDGTEAGLQIILNGVRT